MKLNIIIPNFNKAKFLLKCLQSCNNQDYNNYNIIFIDNESSDNSVEIAKDFKKSCKVDFIIDTAKNIYPRCWEECLEVAFKYCDGEYYTIVGSDDHISETYLSQFVNSIDLNNKPMLVQSAMTWYKENVPVHYTEYKYNSIEELKFKLINGCAVNSPTVFYHTSLIKRRDIQSNPDLYSGASDYDYFCQIVNHGLNILSIKDIGYCYNINETQATWEMHKDQINYSNVIIKKWKNIWNFA